MTNFALLLTYDGTDYDGWQCNGQNRSVEGILKLVLQKLFQENLNLEAASRTDAGVHAYGQVVSFKTKNALFSPEQLQYSLNRLCPENIRVRDCISTPQKFHPTLDCKSKTYIYTVCIGPYQSPFSRFTSWYCPGPLNVETMESCASFLCGTHDFYSFLSQKKTHPYKDTVRNLEEFSLKKEGSQLKIKIRGRHFFYKMVRTLVGTLVQVGRGKIELSEVPNILVGRDRKSAGLTAPPHGLCLWEIDYGLPIFRDQSTNQPL